MNVLITGASGCLGSFLVRDFIERPILSLNVTAASRSFNRLKQNLPNDAASLLIDWKSEKSIKAACVNQDVVIHTAGLDAVTCLLDPEKANLVNNRYTQSLVSACVYANVKHLLLLSTVHVYSPSLNSVIDENSMPANDFHPYAKTKLAAEKSAEALLKEIGNCRLSILRLSNVVAPPPTQRKKDWNLLIPDLVRQYFLNGDVLELTSNVDSERDFVSATYFSEVILDCVMNSNDSRMFNVSSELSFTITEIADLVAERLSFITSKPIKIEKRFPQKQQSEKNLTIKNSIAFKDSMENIINDIDQIILTAQSYWTGKNK